MIRETGLPVNIAGVTSDRDKDSTLLERAGNALLPAFASARPLRATVADPRR